MPRLFICFSLLWTFSSIFYIFMFFLELMVAAIQAFIFTNLTAVFIGQAIEDAHGHEEHDHHHEEATA